MQNDTLTVLNTLRKTIRDHQMLIPGETILVGVSGGADSVCLLHALRSVQEEFDIQLAVAHLNHGIRGEEAERDAVFVKELCKKWGIPCFCKQEDIPALSKKEGISEETAGRLARYRFFHKLCVREGFSKIATAHNRDDQAETMLMRVLRGTGIAGMGGIRYIRTDGVIRPLLNVERRQVEAYCSENGLNYLTDSTNAEETYTRNKIRHQLLPLIKREFNPNITETLAVMAENMAEDGDFLNSYAKRLYQRINTPAPARKPVVLDIESLKMVIKSIRSRLILFAAKDAMGKDYSLERCHIEAVDQLIKKENGAAVDLPGGLRVAVRYGWLAFETRDEQQSIKEQTAFGEIQYELELGKRYEIGEMGMILELCQMPVSLTESQMLVDYDKVKELPLQIRNRRQGDRIAVYQDGRERKLKDFLIDAKIPVWKRGGIPLLCSGDKVIAVIGYRVAEPYKADKNTKRGMVIHYG